MLELALVDANEKTNREYRGIVSSVVGGWLRWECARAGVALVAPDKADVVLLVFAGALDWLAQCRAELRRQRIEPVARNRAGRPYVVAGGPCDAIPATALAVADALAVGEAYTFVRTLLAMVHSGCTLDELREWIALYPHAIERGQFEALRRDTERPWLLAAPAPPLASPDPYVDWMGVPPIRSDDKVVRVVAEKGCHCK